MGVVLSARGLTGVAKPMVEKARAVWGIHKFLRSTYPEKRREEERKREEKRREEKRREDQLYSFIPAVFLYSRLTSTQAELS